MSGALKVSKKAKLGRLNSTGISIRWMLNYSKPKHFLRSCAVRSRV